MSVKVQFRPFKEARSFARSLHLKTVIEWNQYCKSGNKPEDIPAYPNQTYKNSGWAGVGDWLGTGNVANRNKVFRSYSKARLYVRTLNIRSSREWKAYCRSLLKPDDIPVAPHIIYSDKGWAGWGDWLGTGKVANHLRSYRSFDQARVYVHSLKLKSREDWNKYCQSGLKPLDIPASPGNRYYNNDWSGYGDWLGTGTIAPWKRTYRSFDEARAFVRALGLKNAKDWEKYCRIGDKPDDIPARPDRTYAGKGWMGLRDWLGEK